MTYRLSALSCCAFVVMLCCSCSGTTKETNAFELTDFTKIDLSGSGEIVTQDVELIGRASGLQIVNDSIIAVCNNSGGSQVSLYNLNTGEIQPAIFRGNGENEMFRVTSMSTDSDGILWVSGLRDRKVMTARWNEDGGKAITQLVYRAPMDILRGVADGQGGIIALPALQASPRALRINAVGEITDSLGAYPDTHMPDSIQANNFMFQADLLFSPSSGNLVIANKSWPQISIYNIEDSKTTSVIPPVGEEIAIVKESHGQGISLNPKPLWFIFSDVKASDGGFIVGYIGVKVENKSDLDRQISSLLEFTWEGTPLRQFVLENETPVFDIDPHNGWIYTIEDRPEPSLVRYKIK